ncbi:MAG TPA: PDZ domain-containing protein [Candidatus Acidoferrum sp.]|nr:PDZ domain-containing protein [Candidatus Acidoferrum sp.]
MFRTIWCGLLLIVVSSAVFSQTPDNSSPAAVFTPTVRINDRATELQSNLYSDYYRVQAVADDMSWVAAHESNLLAFWQQSSDSVLNILAEISGISWRESAFDIYLVRYFPSIGSPDPLVVPIGGIRQGSLIEAAPPGNQLAFDLIYQLAGRMLLQATRPDASGSSAVANHPMMQPTPYRRELLTLLLAYETGSRVFGADSMAAIYDSPFWKDRFLGQPIFEELLLHKWTLSAERPLVNWLANEPSDSKLITSTSVPDLPDNLQRKTKRQFIEGLPLKGQLGFSVRLNNANRLVVDGIDQSRLAYACGLRKGDIIRQVGGKSVRTQKELIDAVLADLDNVGAVLQVMRNDKNETVFLRPSRPSTGGADTKAASTPDTLTKPK